MLLLAVAAILWGLWEGFRALGIRYGWTRPFTVDATTMPHVHSMLQALFERPNPEAPLLVVTLLKAALFTAKEAALGFAMGATGGFAIGAVLAHSRLLQRGFLPYVVASQTVPILAIAPTMLAVAETRSAVKRYGSEAGKRSFQRTVQRFAAYERISSTARWSAACRPRSVAITTGKNVR